MRFYVGVLAFVVMSLSCVHTKQKQVHIDLKSEADVIERLIRASDLPHAEEWFTIYYGPDMDTTVYGGTGSPGSTWIANPFIAIYDSDGIFRVSCDTTLTVQDQWTGNKQKKFGIYLKKNGFAR